MIFKSNFFNMIVKLKYLWNLTRIFNWTALICAIVEGHKEIVELLIRQEGIDINIKNVLNKNIHFIQI